MFQAHIFASNVMSSPENIQTLSEGKKILRRGSPKGGNLLGECGVASQGLVFGDRE